MPGDTAPFSRATRVRATADQASAALENETVILSVRAGAYFGLDHVGSRIWALLQEETTLGAICDRVVAEYEVDEATAFTDLAALVADLEHHGLVEVRAAPRM